MTAPMTAAEYRSEVGVPRTILGERLLAALEERDANLAHARIGSLVAAIREKRLALRDVSGKGGNFVIGVGEPRIYFLVHDDDGFEEALSHLDSLLPKEPEVRASGFWYKAERIGGDRAVAAMEGDLMQFYVVRSDDSKVPPSDRDVVAALMAKGGKDG